MRPDLTSALPVIETDRLSLRQLRRSDVAELYAIFSDPIVVRYWGFARLTTLAEAEALFDEIEEGRRTDTLFQWGITLKDVDVVIGTTTIGAWEREHRRAELGFALQRAYWGRGYGAEAARATIDFGFRRMNLHRFEADADPRNDASLAILKRLGFREEGRYRERYLVEGEAQDGVIFGLLRSEWLARNREASNS